jgi:hypothetical protein
MTALCNERGAALVAALSISMILLPLGVLVALQCRTDLIIQHNLRSDIEAFYVAEAGLAHAVAEIPPGRSFDQILAGPDHLLGTNDDGAFPFVGGPPAAFPYPPLRYDVQVAPRGSNALRIVSRASGPNGSAKVVEELVKRSPLPFTPSALYRETTSANVTLGVSFSVSGIDHQVVFPPLPEAQPRALLPAVSTPSADAESSLRTDLAPAAPGQISGAGRAPSVATVEKLSLDDYATSVANSPTASTLPATSVDDAIWGTRSAPQLSVVAGDLTVSGRLVGSGVLVVKGTFEVTGTVEFSGLVIALGAVLYEPSSSVTVVGTLWQAASQDERLELGGSGVVAYSSSALSDLDRAFPTLLPHAVVVAGWLEQM